MFYYSFFECLEERIHGFGVHVFWVPLDAGDEVAVFSFYCFNDAVSGVGGGGEGRSQFFYAFFVDGVDEDFFPENVIESTSFFDGDGMGGEVSRASLHVLDEEGFRVLVGHVLPEGAS